MGRIKDTELYALDQYLTLDDYVIGSDAENLGKTQNYGLRGIFDTFRNALNLTSIEYTFSDGTDPDLDQTDAGYFTSNNVLAGAVTSLYVNKLTLSGGNISSLVDIVSQNVSSFVFRLYQPSAAGQVFFFVIDTIIDNGTYYTFNVENFVGSNTLVDSTTYGVAFDLAGVPSIVNETDPIFTASPAAGITAPKIVNWDAAFGWGDHSLVGYLTTETDPVFSASAASGIIGAQITNWDTAFGWGNHSTVGYLTSETDPTVPSYVKTILASDITNWNLAYGWGNHALAGYVTTETDPVFSASVAAGITLADKGNWTAAYGWGNHALFGYVREINIDTLAELNSIVTDATLITDAPSDGSNYVRNNAAWVSSPPAQWGSITGTLSNQTDLQLVLDGKMEKSIYDPATIEEQLVGLTAPQTVENKTLTNTTSVNFDTTYTSTGTEPQGTLYWNNTDETLDLVRDGTTLQVGQELYAKVRNVSGVTIPNASVVYTSGSTGIYPQVSLALADSESTATTLGLSTEDISSPSFGTITTYGYVRGIKTNYSGAGVWGTTWVEGDVLYLSKTTAGQLTNIEPNVPHFSGRVATVGVVHPSQGSVLVGLDRYKRLDKLSDVNGTPLTVTGQMLLWDNTNGYFDFTDNINNYLPLTGGTLTGNTYVDGGTGYLQLGVKRTVSAVEATAYMAINGGNGSAIFGSSKGGFIEISTSQDIRWYNGTGYEDIWTSGNDGAGSGLDADLLDGIQLSQIVNPELNYIVNDTRVVDTPTDLGERGLKFEFKANGTGGLSDGSSGFYGVQTFQQWSDSSGGETHQLAFTGNKNLWLRNATVGAVGWNSWVKIWHQGNDGSGSGLDADLLGGVTYANFFRTDRGSGGDANSYTLDGTSQGRPFSANHPPASHGRMLVFGKSYSGTSQIFIDDSSGMAVRGQNYLGTWSSWAKVWSDLNDGAGSGLDADLYHGYDLTAAGNRFGVMAEVRSDGVMNVGKYLDFHNTDTTTGLDGRITLTATNKWAFSSGEVSAYKFESTVLTSNSATATDTTRMDGYGIMGNRVNGIYITNAATGGDIRIGNNGIHNIDNIAIFSNTGLAVTNAISATTTITATTDFNLLSGQYSVHGNHSRVKYAVWTGSTYGIGMASTYTYGSLNGYAMTFQMNNTVGRGWWWGTNVDTNAQGSMSLTVAGQLTLKNTATATDFIASSDRRLKTNIETLKGDSLNLRWVEFNRISDGEYQLGLIAQEVEKIKPEFVVTDKEGFKSVKYTSVFVAKLAEKDREIEDLTERIERLELIVKELL